MADPINGAGTTPQAQNGGAPVPVETPAQLAEKRKAGITEVYLSANGKLSHDWLKTAIEGTQTVEEVKLSALKELTSDKPAPGAVNVIVRQEPETTTELLSAAVSIAVKKTDGIGAETLDKANRMFSRGLGLGELMLCAARANGYQGRGIRDQREVMRFAFANSTVNIAGILSNVANKFLLGGYEMVDQTWRQISTIRSVSDFKTITSYRLTGANSVGTVNHGGELPLGNLTEESYTNSAATYGVRFAISRTDIVNDDLGAITSVPTKIGRDHAEKFNRVFWAAFMDNASFFASGNSNYISGATTVLSLDSLASGYATLEAMKDADSKVIGVKPAILLVPSALRMTARNLCESENIVTGKDATLGSRNGMAGLLRYASCAYLQDSTITGYSSVAWYLLAEPGAIGVVESVFLNGNETPTVETADADFATLGIQMRGYFDYGVAKQDKRGGLKSKGAA